MDLFDTEIQVEHVVRRVETPARPSSSEPLFLAESDDTAAAVNGIDKLFEDIEDDRPLDLEAMKRQAEAQPARNGATQHAILPSSSPVRDTGRNGDKGGEGKDGDKKKAKKKAMRLDEGRLLGPDGFPQLIKDTKTFKPKGKGHEASDLNRLLQVYGFWTHKLYPKTPFQDTVERVEKLCHTKRVQVALTVWKDEAAGTINGKNIQVQDAMDLTSDAENAEKAAPRPRARLPPSSPTSSPNRNDVDVSMEAPPPRPPSSASEPDFDMDDNFDFDAMLREDEQRREAEFSASKNSTNAVASGSDSNQYDGGDFDYDAMIAEDEENSRLAVAKGKRKEVMDDDEDELWAQLDKPKASTRASATEEVDDEDMWDLVQEMEAPKKAMILPAGISDDPSGPTGSNTVPSKTNVPPEEDKDDLYI